MPIEAQLLFPHNLESCFDRLLSLKSTAYRANLFDTADCACTRVLYIIFPGV